MQPRVKFILGGLVVLGTAGILMAGSFADTAVYFLTPAELEAKVLSDPDIRSTGVKVGAKVVPGTVVRAESGRQVNFDMTDGKATYKVEYKGIIPDTFSDSVDVVVEGRLGEDGVFRATTLLAKCASRYEAAPDGMKPDGRDAYEAAMKPTAGAESHPAGVPMASPATQPPK